MNKKEKKLISDSKKLLKQTPRTLVELFLQGAMEFIINQIERKAGK